MSILSRLLTSPSPATLASQNLAMGFSALATVFMIALVGVATMQQINASPNQVTAPENEKTTEQQNQASKDQQPLMLAGVPVAALHADTAAVITLDLQDIDQARIETLLRLWFGGAYDVAIAERVKPFVASASWLTDRGVQRVAMVVTDYHAPDEFEYFFIITVKSDASQAELANDLNVNLLKPRWPGLEAVVTDISLSQDEKVAAVVIKPLRRVPHMVSSEAEVNPLWRELLMMEASEDSNEADDLVLIMAPDEATRSRIRTLSDTPTDSQLALRDLAQWSLAASALRAGVDADTGKVEIRFHTPASDVEMFATNIQLLQNNAKQVAASFDQPAASLQAMAEQIKASKYQLKELWLADAVIIVTSSDTENLVKATLSPEAIKTFASRALLPKYIVEND